RAVAVEYRHGAELIQVRAEREVLLSAGTIGSPQLLLLSGIGPARELESLGIAVTANRAEVGHNLQDHLDFCTVNRCRQSITYDYTRAQALLVGLRYFLTHSGPGASNIAEAGAVLPTPPPPHRAADLRPGAARGPRTQPPARPWIHHPRLRAAAGEPRRHHAALEPARRPPAHRSVLPVSAGRPRGTVGGHAAVARDHCRVAF